MYALNLGDDGRVLSATYDQYAVDGMPRVEALPDGDVLNYRYVDGDYIYDPLPAPDAPKEEKSIQDQIRDLQAQMEVLMRRLEGSE